MDTSLIQELPEIFAKFTEKQKAIWAQSFTPSAQSTRRAKEAYAQDALKMARAMASHPEAMLHAWGHWVTHAPLHAFSLFEEEHPQPQEFTQLLKEYFTGFHTLSKETLAQWVSELEEVDEKSRHRFLFYTLQWMEALSPAHNIFTNPELATHTLKEGGDNLFKGFDNFLNDISCTSGELSIRMTDPHAFEVGKNLATTPGAVVHRNDVMELIHYAPTTETVYKRPLLLVPPWINKFYILDLNEKTSMVKWLVDQGFSLFLISWVNPDGPMEKGSFEGYMKEGILTALTVITEITGEKRPHAAGYCTGGTLLATTLAWLAAKKEDRVASATFMATPIDFSMPGDLGIFIDQAQVDALISETSQTGYLDGQKLATIFNMLRPNDLVWNYVVKNYLKGEAPIPFDILYWNSDSTHIPAEMYAWHLKNTYLENNLAKSEGVKLAGRTLKIKAIKIPTYHLATLEDHIVLWQGAYKGAHLMGGPIRFVLAESGHVAGVVNPPPKEKYGFYTNRATSKTPEGWQKNSTHHTGSWWKDWARWLKPRSGKKVAASPSDPGPLGPAPGTYVTQTIGPPKRCRDACSCQKPPDPNAFPMAP